LACVSTPAQITLRPNPLVITAFISSQEHQPEPADPKQSKGREQKDISIANRRARDSPGAVPSNSRRAGRRGRRCRASGRTSRCTGWGSADPELGTCRHSAVVIAVVLVRCAIACVAAEFLPVSLISLHSDTSRCHYWHERPHGRNGLGGSPGRRGGTYLQREDAVWQAQVV